MKVLTTISVILLILLSAGMETVRAQEEGTVELKAVAEMELAVVNDDGQTEIQRVPAAKVVPGDVVIYTIHYTNKRSEPAENFVITNPVPQHMVYLESSAEGENTNITFSIDGGNTYDIPDNLTIASSDGNRVPAKPSDYTHIQWAFNDPVAPNQTGLVNFKARLK